MDEECEGIFTEQGEGYGLGDLNFEVPENTSKWRVEITFDSPLTSFDEFSLDTDECNSEKNICFFENDDFNAQKLEGEEVNFSFEGYFDEDQPIPKIEKVIFRSSNSELFNGWTTIVLVCEKNDE